MTKGNLQPLPFKKISLLENFQVGRAQKAFIIFLQAEISRIFLTK